MRTAGLVLAALALADALPQRRVVKRDVSELRDSYDFVVVGGGTAGLVVANRLSEAFPSRNTLVVEYGTLEQATPQFDPPDSAPGATQLNLESEPIEALGGRRAALGLGMTVGGSSAVNGQFFDRGSRFDYDDWAKIGEFEGEERWDWEGIVPFFKKSVTFHEPSEEEVEEYGYTYDVEAAYGGTTPVHAIFPPYQFPIQKFARDAFVEMGLTEQEECAAGDKHGICYVPTSQYPSTAARSHAGLAHYLDVIGSRANYDLLVGHKVTRLLFEEGVEKPPVVEFKPVGGEDGETGTVKAGLEVVVSAGAIHTPQILQRSGIGEAAFLEEAGIEVVADLPGVGWNLQDHCGPPITFELTEDVGPVEETLETNATFLAESIAQYEEHPAQGPYTLAMGNSAIYVSLPNVTPDHEAIVSAIRAQVSNGTAASHLPHDVPASVAEGYAAQLSLLADSLSNPQHPVLEAPWMGTVPATGFLLKPLSRGSVRINASNPDAEPVIDYRTASNPVDMDIMASYIPFFRQYFSTPTMTALGAHEVAPGADVVSVEGIKEYLRGAVIGSFMHPCCTASMMPESKGGVVGPDLRVHGLGGVRVADISVVPLIPGTHTSATAYAIGEKAADIVIRAWAEDEGSKGGKAGCKRTTSN